MPKIGIRTRTNRKQIANFTLKEKAMNALIRVIELLLIGLLFALAMQNDAPVQFTIMNDWFWTKPLIIWLFLFFVGGVLLGLLATTSLLLKKRSEIKSR